MYHRRVSTAFIFIVLFTIIELVFASIAWKTFGKNMWDNLHEAFATDELVLSQEDDAILNTTEEIFSPAEITDNEDDDYLTED